MKSLKISSYSSIKLHKILEKFQKKKSNDVAFIKWLFVWYVGSSILLLLSLHSYYMGFGV